MDLAHCSVHVHKGYWETISLPSTTKVECKDAYTSACKQV